MLDIKSLLKNLLLFQEPEKSEGFILKETPEESAQNAAQDKGQRKHKIKKTGVLKRLIGSKTQDDGEPADISSKIQKNLDFIKNAYSVPENSDLIIREFDINVKDKAVQAFAVFFDGMTDRKAINDNILQPLMLLSGLDINGDEANVAKYIKSHILPFNQLKETRSHRKVIDQVNFGGCGIYIDGVSVALIADVKGFEHRAVERPNTEQIIRGPQESFTETIRVNTALLRKRLKDERLIIEGLEIGKRSKTPCAMLYIKDIANDSLVNEVRKRLKNIKVDYIFDSGELEQYIEDAWPGMVPTVIASERPDRIASMLAEGRVAVIVNGSPFVLAVPVTSDDFLHTVEDNYIRYPYTNLLRFIRVLGIAVSLTLPGLYVAITNFHQEMIPTDLLFAIEASRERVPFPSVIEILIMEVSFELIREAGIRIPGPIGPTLGIIGALILGQAAVAANIVSPILIIIVAVTGIGSFSVPNFSYGFVYRILRFAYIFLGAIAGLLGISVGLFLQGLWLAATKSFGVPYLSPYAPKTAGEGTDRIIKMPAWKQEKRPDYLNPKIERQQEDISMAWRKKENKGDEGGE